MNWIFFERFLFLDPFSFLIITNISFGFRDDFFRGKYFDIQMKCRLPRSMMLFSLDGLLKQPRSRYFTIFFFGTAILGLLQTVNIWW